ncbi:MAG: di-heme enzyme [Bryobacterales bacterium]|nr:di-heme enzyme [Bryobacterales bacterium]MBV9398983.1 di-heme enzyme [Bryobacterales bacterium]
MRPLIAFAALAWISVYARAGEPDAYDWNLPKGFPKPRVPADNPMTTAKVELGRYLFYDTRMSVNGKASCATCHKQELAFTDGRAAAIGATGESHSRSAMSLVNIAYSGALTWSNPNMTQLEDQALVPMFGERPVELGRREGDGFLSRLRSETKYRELFGKAFPGESEPFTTANVTKAVACFERSIISARSPYDRYHYGGEDHAVPYAAKRGEILFFSQNIACFRCHGGFNFSDASVSDRSTRRSIEFHNTGLYSPYPAPNFGIYEFTHDPADIGKFKTPTLRNVAVTAPYMHDGSARTLEDVLDHYAAGGRAHDNPNKDPLVHGFALSKEERADLAAFLQSLTDEELLNDRRFSNPWPSK